MNQEPRCLYISPSTLSFACLALLTVSTVVAQDRIIPAGQSNSKSTRKTHVATVHSTDSSEGSRVAITSDQSLNNYEAYRRGDRFYVKIPAADVSRAESARGRGFADVKSQRNGDNTVLSFRLQPGASAHVEQRGNKLDVVVSVPGGPPATAGANRPGGAIRPAITDSSRAEESNKRGNARSNNSSGGKQSNNANDGVANSASANANESRRRSGASPLPDNSNSSVSTGTAGANATPDPARQSQASAGTQAMLPTPAPQSSSIANIPASPSAATVGTARETFWTRAKQRGHYWLLLAQLNPIPVALGAMLLVFIIMLVLFQRRRARSTRRPKTVTKSTPTAVAAAGGVAASNETETALSAETATVVAAVQSGGSESPAYPLAAAATVPVSAAVPPASGSETVRRERVNRAGEEVKKVLAGDRYDENFVGSEDPETRRLVGAELLSALVSRNATRRQHARAAFMKHGYFEDATRDLRVADSENERAAAARRLSFLNEREATPHLIGALHDPSPDVRRAVVEALMDVRDPAAIAPLNALLQNEKDRKVPRNLIQKAIEACATNPAPELHSSPAQMPPPATFNTDREVIEI